MEGQNSPPAPSACSVSSLTGEIDDTVSVPSTENENERTSTPSFGRTLVDYGSERLEKHTCGLKKTCLAGAREQQTGLEIETAPFEERKMIWTKSRKRAFRHFLFLHLAPISITVAMFSLYIQNFQWMASDIQLKALLFAAKLHESLILISLADILFHRIRYHLLTDRGISFGLLVAPFQFSNPLALFQAPFLSSAKFTLKSGPELLTISLFVLVSALALLTSPSSGALMLPRYDWWQVPEGDDSMTRFMEQDPETAAYVGAPFEELFPSLIDGTFRPDTIRDTSLDIISLSDGMGQIISGVEGALVNDASLSNDNITVVDGTTVDSFTLSYQQKSLEKCNVTAQEISKLRTVDEYCRSVEIQATAPLAFVTQNLFNRYRTWKSASESPFMITAQALAPKKKDLTWRQPTVSMQCSVAPPDVSKDPISLSQWGSFSPLHIYPDQQLQERIEKARGGPSERVDASTSLRDLQATMEYMNISHLLPEGAYASTALLMNFFKITPTHISSTTHLCLVDARWIDSHVWFTAPFPTVMRSGTSMQDVQTATGVYAAANTGSAINITAEYANSLNTNLSVISTYSSYRSQFTPLTDTPFGLIDTGCAARVTDGLRFKCSMLAHAMYLTDSLRRAQSLFRYRTGKELSEAEGVTLLVPGQWTKLDYRLYRQLYAYQFEGLIIQLSMVVLLVHMMLVYAHLLLLILGDGWCSRAWSELGELIALAIMTRPSSLLENAGGGVKNWKTWRLRTFVREITPEGRLELILKQTGDSPRVLLADDTGREKVSVQPEANRKYG